MNTFNYILRIENTGLIIWDPVLNCYFFTQNKKLITLQEQDLLDYILHNLPLQMSRLRTDNKNSLTIIDNQGKSDRALFAPLEYYFDYTNMCNLKCNGCYNKFNLNESTIGDIYIGKIIKEMHKLGIMRLHLAGGEPFYYPKLLLKYLNTAKEEHVIVSMATNGTLITRELATNVLSTDPLAISVSVDGYNEQSNSKNRGTGAFYNAISGINNLIWAKSKVKCNTEICLKPTLYNYYNSFYLEEIVKLGISLKVDRIKFSNPERSLNHPMGFYSNNFNNYYKQLFEVKEIIEKYSSSIKIDGIFNPLNNCTEIGIPGLKGCIGGQELIAISPNGKISPCLMYDRSLGNYFEFKSMENFYLKSKLLNAYLNENSNNICNNCSVYPYCRGGCQVRKQSNYLTLDYKDPYCPYNNIPLEQIISDDNKTMLFKQIYVHHSL